MAAEDGAALEAEQDVLADRLDALKPPSVQLRRKLLHRRARVGRLDLQLLSDQHLQPAGGAVDSVPFRQACSVLRLGYVQQPPELSRRRYGACRGRYTG